MTQNLAPLTGDEDTMGYLRAYNVSIGERTRLVTQEGIFWTYTFTWTVTNNSTERLYNISSYIRMEVEHDNTLLPALNTGRVWYGGTSRNIRVMEPRAPAGGVGPVQGVTLQATIAFPRDFHYATQLQIVMFSADSANRFSVIASQTVGFNLNWHGSVEMPIGLAGATGASRASRERRAYGARRATWIERRERRTRRGRRGRRGRHQHNRRNTNDDLTGPERRQGRQGRRRDGRRGRRGRRGRAGRVRRVRRAGRDRRAGRQCRSERRPRPRRTQRPKRIQGIERPKGRRRRRRNERDGRGTGRDGRGGRRGRRGRDGRDGRDGRQRNRIRPSQNQHASHTKPL